MSKFIKRGTNKENVWEHGNIEQLWKGTREQGPPWETLCGSSLLESFAPLAATHFFPLLCLIQCIVSSVFTSFLFLLLNCNCISVNKWT